MLMQEETKENEVLSRSNNYTQGADIIDQKNNQKQIIKWTALDDQALLEAVASWPGNWIKITSYVGNGHDSKDCMARRNQILKKNDSNNF